VSPKVVVDRLVTLIKCSNDSKARRKSSEIMLWLKRALRKLGGELFGLESPFILPDGPIVDPPLLSNPSYV